MKTHQDLNAWKDRIERVVKIYQLTKLFPKEELFSLTSPFFLPLHHS